MAFILVFIQQKLPTYPQYHNFEGGCLFFFRPRNVSEPNLSTELYLLWKKWKWSREEMISIGYWRQLAVGNVLNGMRVCGGQTYLIITAETFIYSYYYTNRKLYTESNPTFKFDLESPWKVNTRSPVFQMLISYRHELGHTLLLNTVVFQPPFLSV